jgi:hypothetical protein
MIGMFNDTLSILEIWFFDESRMIQGFASLTRDGKELSLCARSQALDLINYSTQVAKRYQTHGILNTYVGFILNSTRAIIYWCLEVNFTSTTLFYWFTTGTTCKFTEGPCSHASST